MLDHQHWTENDAEITVEDWSGACEHVLSVSAEGLATGVQAVACFDDVEFSSGIAQRLIQLVFDVNSIKAGAALHFNVVDSSNNKQTVSIEADQDLQSWSANLFSFHFIRLRHFIDLAIERQVSGYLRLDELSALDVALIANGGWFVLGRIVPMKCRRFPRGFSNAVLRKISFVIQPGSQSRPRGSSSEPAGSSPEVTSRADFGRQ